ncbi:MAG TPA: sialate O-acetylesterase, partial [Luteolibacter sp.]
FRGILWHQGESNAYAYTTTEDYKTWLNAVIAESRVDAGWEVPWYVAEVSRGLRGLATEEFIAAAQRAVIFGDPLVLPGPVTDYFHQEGKLQADGIHYNAAGLLDHATQWAEILGGTPPLAPKNANFESNTALADGNVATISTTATVPPYVNGWRTVNAANDGVADGSCGYFNPNATLYQNTADNGANGGVLPNMAGRHAAFLSGSSANACFLQTRRALLRADHTYTLTAAIGVRSAAATFGGATLELLAEGNVLVSRTIDRAGLDALNGGNASGKFTDIALSFITGQTVTPGQPLAIRIRKPGGAGTYLDFDNVRLTAAATPYASWQSEHFDSTSVAAAGWDANPDADTFVNAIEYLLGLDPQTRDAPDFLSQVERAGTSWARYQVPMDPAIDASSLSLWYSFDLSDWHPAASSPDGSVVEFRQADEWALEVSKAAHPRAFFQLRAGPQSP